MTTVPQIIEAGQSLPALAADANREYALVLSGVVDSVKHAISCGDALRRARKLIPHGEWLPWVAANFSGTERTARRYLQLAANRTRVADLDSERAALRLLSGGTHVANNSGEIEWYTPPEYIDAARKVMGGIDIDPASCAKANKTVNAKRFFSKNDDGLIKEWHGRVWMNPPYARDVVDAFSAKLAAEVRVKRVTQACVLVNNATDTFWFQNLAGIASALCFPESRVAFLDPSGEPKGKPLQGQAVIYVGDNVAEFVSEFSSIGMCWVKPE
jgi:hypothetical protein